MTNIKDVANACNVSSATVSRALSGVGYVDKEKKDMILKKAEELGYIVDTHAKSLKSGKSSTIGIIVADVGNYFYNMVLEQLIVEFKKLKYNVLLSYSFENTDYERENMKSMLSSRVDALIFTPVSNTNKDLIDIMIKREITVLQLFRQAYPNIDALCVDDEYGSYLATKHLIEAGHRRILLLSVKLDYTPNRANGYINAIEECGLKIDHSLIHLFPLGHSIEKQVEELITKLNPDAIIAGTNNFGLDTLLAMKSLNKKIHLVAFDNLEWFDLLSVSTVSQPIEDIYTLIVSNVMLKIKGDKHLNNGTLIMVKPKLIARNSSL